MIQADARPFELVERLEEADARGQAIRGGIDCDRALAKDFCEGRREKAIWLVAEVDGGFGGVVPSGIFKIEEAEGSVILAKRVVEPEIRGG